MELLSIDLIKNCYGNYR